MFGIHHIIYNIYDNNTIFNILSRAREAGSPLNLPPERRQGTPMDMSKLALCHKDYMACVFKPDHHVIVLCGTLHKMDPASQVIECLSMFGLRLI